MAMPLLEDIVSAWLSKRSLLIKIVRLEGVRASYEVLGQGELSWESSFLILQETLEPAAHQTAQQEARQINNQPIIN